MSPRGIAYFGIGNYSVTRKHYDSTQHPSGLCGLKNQVKKSEQAKHCGLDAIRFRHIQGIKFILGETFTPGLTVDNNTIILCSHDNNSPRSVGSGYRTFLDSCAFRIRMQINCDPDHLTPLDNKSSRAGRSQTALVPATV